MRKNAIHKEISMKKRYSFLFFLIIHLPCIASGKVILTPSSQTGSENNNFGSESDLNPLMLMTAQDLSRNGSSNLNLTNNTGEALTVYGVYLYGVASITPVLNCTNGIAGSSNSTIQPFMSGLTTPIEFTIGQSIPIGQNYLYNMIYAWSYFRSSSGGNPGCLLPGCTWTGDTPHNWCLQLGALSPDASYTFAQFNTNVVPFSWAPTNTTSPYNFNYNLIPNNSSAYTWAGPFTCDDKTLTCTAFAPQYQPFPS